MHIKITSTAKIMHALIAVFLCAMINAVSPFDAWAQEKPLLEKPLKVCRVYQGIGGHSHLFASDNNSNIIYSNEQNFLISVNLETNLENWKFQAGGSITSAIVSDAQNLYFLTSYENEKQEKIFTLNSVSKKTGLPNWQKKLGIATNLVLSETSVEKQLFVIAENNTVNSVIKTDGNINWTKNITSPIISIEASDAGLISILSQESILNVSAQNGNVTGEFKIKINPTSNSSKNSSYILLGYSNGEFVKVSSAERNSVLWRIKTGGSISSLIEIGSYTLVSSLDNFLYLYSTDNGKLKWKRRVSGRINIKPVIYEKYAIVLSSSDNIGSIVELDEGRIINQVQLEDGNYFSDEPRVMGRYILFPTARGIHVFINSELGCK